MARTFDSTRAADRPGASLAPARPGPARARGVAVRVLATFALVAAAAATAAAQERTIHVATDGSDANTGTAEQPLRTVQRAVDEARGGDTVAVHAGTYEGLVVISGSGAPGNPITLTSAGDGPATLRSTLPSVSCSSTSPTWDRTIQVLHGSDHWVIRGLTVEGGIFVSAERLEELEPYVRDRSLPGRGVNDPVAAPRALERLGVDPADSVQILDNVIRGRGIFAGASRYGRVEGNEIRDVACGTGGGIYLNRFSDGWVVRDNHVHDLASSTEHYMSEGIRQGSSSNYNLIEDNLVEDLAGRGRGITTDANSSWNVIRRNVVRRAEQGFSEQKGGRGNQWLANTAEDNRRYGFAIFNIGFSLTSPNDDVPAYVEMRCNRSVADPVSFNANAVRNSTFRDNDFATVDLSDNLRSYWTAVGNTWNGAGAPPSERPEVVFPRGCLDRAASALWGDVDLDGAVDAKDALAVLNHVAGLPTPEADMELADVDANGRITSRDALIISSYGLGQPTGDARVGDAVGR